MTAVLRENDAEQTPRSRASVAARSQRQLVLRFASNAEVATDTDRPFKGDAFGAPGATR